MRSRTFLHVSLGILALAASYHLGARNATAQAGSTLGYVGWQASEFAVVADRVAYRATNGLPVQLTGALPPIPGTSPVAAFGNDNAVLANGDVYDWTGSGWRFKGNLFGGAPTPAQHESLGALKVRYR